MTDQMQLLLVNELKVLCDAREVLMYSFNKCSAIGIKDTYQPEELESFESFTGRFARIDSENFPAGGRTGSGYPRHYQRQNQQGGKERTDSQ